MQKPVWRMNTGDGVPNDFGGDCLLKEGELFSDFDRVRAFYKNEDWAINDNEFDVVAYQTTRTKAAKYQRVKCDWCVNGYELMGISTCDICRKCNGKADYWENI